MRVSTNIFFYYVVAITFLFSSCSNTFLQTPTATPINTLIPTATLTATPSSTNTPIPTNTKLPECNVDQTLKELKQVIDYDEFALLYQKIQGLSILVVWFVDPELDEAVNESELTSNTQLAVQHAFLLNQKMKAFDNCIERLFSFINPIVVDKNYNGWFSGQIVPTDLPVEAPASDEELNTYTKLYQIGYLRTNLTTKQGTPPSGSCSWPDTRTKIQNHFAAERENVAFHFVIDETGVNIWAQWDSPEEILQLNLPASLLNIALELDCLYPEPDRIIFDVIDETGEIRVYGVWEQADMKNQNLGNVQILYQK
jgi:hypothetical protein